MIPFGPRVRRQRTKHMITCPACDGPIWRVVCGNIIDYKHNPNGNDKCPAVKVEAALRRTL